MSFAAWAFGERKRAVEEPELAEEQPLISDRLAVAAGRGLDPPKKRTFRSKLATSLVFATIFCAGAALTAGAGNEAAKMSDTPLAETTLTDTVDATAPAADPAPAVEPAPVEAAPVEAVPVEAAPVEAAPVEAAPVEAAPAEAAPAETASAEAAPVAAAPVEAAPAEAAPTPAPEATANPAPAPDPADATPAKATAAAAPVAAKATVKPARTVAKRTARKAVVRKQHAAPALAAIPLRALMFDPQLWLNNNPASSTGASAVAITAQYLGVPYVWGGAVPATGFDCSGLTRFVYQQLGVQLPHYAAAQFAMFPKLDPADLAPGDLVFFEPRVDGPGHVAVYVGDDQIIAAPHTGALVRYSSLSSTAAALGFMGAVRPYGATAAAVVEQDLGPQWSGSMQVSLFARPE
jgi:cell wall-associated NlpC family hydrolase